MLGDTHREQEGAQLHNMYTTQLLQGKYINGFSPRCACFLGFLFWLEFEHSLLRTNSLHFKKLIRISGLVPKMIKELDF